MRTLIQNYTSAISTEAMYIERCLLESGEQAQLWANPELSAFDAFDTVNPDLFITHYTLLTHDIIKYLSSKPSISTAMNITGATEEDISKIEDLCSNIDLPILFTNLYETANRVESKKIKTITLYPAADIFLPPIATPDFSIQSCVLSIQKNDLYDTKLKDIKTYHKLSLNPQADYGDMSLDIASVRSFYDKYEEVVLADDINFVTSQVLFDSILGAKKVSLEVFPHQREALDKILAELFIQQETDDIADLIKSQVKNRHNCFKRCARLFRSLKSEDVALKMEGISSKL